jgi:DNA-binding NarL/FixJ family response regulator
VPFAVLLVDDEPEFLSLARMLLEGDPALAVIGQATSGEEAIALVPVLHPDVVILDVQMPGMNGFEAARRLTEAAPGLRTVLTSALDQASYSALAEQAGAAAFVAKKDLSVASVLAALGAS